VRPDQDRSPAPALDVSFELFVASASPGLLRSAYLLAGDRRDAEDLVQSALLRTLRRWDQITGSPSAYAFAILVNLAHDRRRTALRRPRRAGDDHAATDRPAPDDLDRLLARDAITRAAQRLPTAQREVIACRFLLDLTVAETAAALGLPQGTVKSYTARGLARMRELLNDDSAPLAGTRPEVRDADR
jgi:RNA polymerase sigma factor (sigma-70 family)